MNAIMPYRDFASLDRPATDYPAIRAKPAGDGRRIGLLRRLFDALARAEQRKADREVVRFFGGRLSDDGVRLTDQLERKLADHFGPRGGFQP